MSKQRGLAMALWFTSPITVLAVAAGLMVDLSGTALATAGLACWREGLAAPRGTSQRWITAAGSLLALACFAKYPHLVWVLLVFLHARFVGRPTPWKRFVIVFGLVWGAGQIWLLAAHGGFHPLAVLAGAAEIGRSSTSARALGTFVRLGLVLPVLLVCLRKAWWKALPAAAAVAGVAIWMAPVPALSQSQTIALVVFASLGALWFLFALTLVLPRGQQRDGDRFFLATWCVLGVISLPLFHNFASARYLLPVVLPFAILASRGFSTAVSSRPMMGFAVGIQAALALALLVADTRFAIAQTALADRAIETLERGQFTGEWTLRWRLESAGWEALGRDDTVEGTLVAVDHAGAREIPESGLVYTERIVAEDHFFIRLSDPSAQAGYYGETLGVLPFALSKAPLDVLRVYRAESAPQRAP